MKYLWIGTLLLCWAVVALADEVQLNNGRTLSGIAHDEGDRWMVETRLGDLRVPKSDVASVAQGRTTLHEYKQRLDALAGCPTADEMFELATWAQDEGLIRYVNPLLTRTIEIDPDHRQARSLLGFVFHEGKWITESQRNTLVEVQENLRRRAAPRPPETARRAPPPEEAPYYMGIRLSRPPRSRTAYSPYTGY
jgi:hypothetical protein